MIGAADVPDQQNFFIQHMSWKGGRRNFRPTSAVALSDFVITERGATGRSIAIFQYKDVRSETAKPVKREAKNGIQKMEAILHNNGRSIEEECGSQQAESSTSSESSYMDATMLPSTLLDTAIIKLLAKLKSFYDRAYKQNPIKAKSRRRLVCGLHEVGRHLLLCTARCVVLARDIEYVSEKEKLSDRVATIRKLCEQNCVPLLEFSKKHKLGSALRAKPFVSAVAVLDYSGAEDLYFTMIEIYKRNERLRRILDHEDQSSLFA